MKHAIGIVLSVLGTGVLACVVGCQEPTVTYHDTPEQREILAYSDASRMLSPAIRAFENAWNEAHSRTAPMNVREVLASSALPSLTLLVETLERSEPKNATLRNIHNPLLESYRRLETLLRECTDALDPRKFLEHHRDVLSEMKNLLLVQERYQKDLQYYFVQHRVFPKSRPPGNPLEGEEPSE